MAQHSVWQGRRWRMEWNAPPGLNPLLNKRARSREFKNPLPGLGSRAGTAWHGSGG
jgi:hypothetical protein